NPIATNVTGIQICEALPKIAKNMDKFAIIRSLVGNQANHDAVQVFNGRHPNKKLPTGPFPQFGSIVSKLQGPIEPAVPAFINLSYQCTHGPYNEPGPGFLGPSVAPFRPTGPAHADMTLKGITVDRLADRKALLRSFDDFRREADAAGMTKAMDTFNEQ